MSISMNIPLPQPRTIRLTLAAECPVPMPVREIYHPGEWAVLAGFPGQIDDRTHRSKTTTCIDQAAPKYQPHQGAGIKSPCLSILASNEGTDPAPCIDGPSGKHISPYGGEIGSAGHTHPGRKVRLHCPSPRSPRASSVQRYSLVICSTTSNDLSSSGNTSQV